MLPFVTFVSVTTVIAAIVFSHVTNTSGTYGWPLISGLILYLICIHKVYLSSFAVIEVGEPSAQSNHINEVQSLTSVEAENLNGEMTTSCNTDEKSSTKCIVIDKVPSVETDNGSEDESNNWRCVCEVGFLPPGLLRSFGGAEAMFKMGAGQCYHKV